jgi:hypothetical protein
MQQQLAATNGICRTDPELELNSSSGKDRKRKSSDGSHRLKGNFPQSSGRFEKEMEVEAYQ